MKPKAQPCLRDYLTIHVPASTMMGDRLRKKHQMLQQNNPLLNQKLQNSRNQNNIAIIYRSSPSKTFGKRKFENIPLLSNIKLDKSKSLRIMKDPTKTSYNFVFETKRSSMEVIPKRDSCQLKRDIFTSHSQKKEKRPFLLTQMKMRESASTHKLDNHYRSESALNVQQSIFRKVQLSRTIAVTGSNAFLRYSEEHRGDNTRQSKSSIYVIH